MTAHPPRGTPCRGAHRACPDRAPATELAGQRAMCARCAAERRAARNRRAHRKRDAGRAADRVLAQVAEVAAERRGPGRPPTVGAVGEVFVRLDAAALAGAERAARELGDGERPAGVRAVLRAYGASRAVRAAVLEHLDGGGE